jgi:hypothetical protein
LKTKIIENIDGIDIIIAIGHTLIDPVATKNNIKPIIEDTNEAKNIKNKIKELDVIMNSLRGCIESAKQNKKNGDIQNYEKNVLDIELRKSQIQQLNIDMIALKKELKKKTLEIWNQNLIYFEPKKGEIIIDDSEAETIGQKLLNLDNAMLDIDGNEIVDYRNVEYIKDGQIIKITKIGIMPDGPLINTYTPEQLEELRINNLTPEEKQLEYNNLVNSLGYQAADMKGKLEIEGDPDPLTKSQTWYNEQIEILKTKYGI